VQGTVATVPIIGILPQKQSALDLNIKISHNIATAGAPVL
jgi:hypothetical protein